MYNNNSYYYLALKKEILPLTWMDVEDIMLGDISQIQKEELHNLIYMWDLRSNTWKQRVEW